MFIAASHIIDLDVEPYIPRGWRGVANHIRGGMLEWHSELLRIYYSPFQRDGKHISGNDLQEELLGLGCLILNTNVLDYWLLHQEVIPEECKNPKISLCFWGTTYFVAKNRPQKYVRQLFLRDDGSFGWTYRAVGTMFDYKFPSAVYRDK